MHSSHRHSRNSDTEGTVLTGGSDYSPRKQCIISSGQQEGSSSVERNSHQSSFCLSEQFDLSSKWDLCGSSESSLADLIKYHKRFMKALGVLLARSLCLHKQEQLSDGVQLHCFKTCPADQMQKGKFQPTVQPAGVDYGVPPHPTPQPTNHSLRLTCQAFVHTLTDEEQTEVTNKVIWKVELCGNSLHTR